MDRGDESTTASIQELDTLILKSRTTDNRDKLMAQDLATNRLTELKRGGLLLFQGKSSPI